eukprot:495161-Pyramimonas_sp.AAC.1
MTRTYRAPVGDPLRALRHSLLTLPHRRRRPPPGNPRGRLRHPRPHLRLLAPPGDPRGRLAGPPRRCLR